MFLTAFSDCDGSVAGLQASNVIRSAASLVWLSGASWTTMWHHGKERFRVNADFAVPNSSTHKRKQVLPFQFRWLGSSPRASAV